MATSVPHGRANVIASCLAVGALALSILATVHDPEGYGFTLFILIPMLMGYWGELLLGEEPLNGGCTGATVAACLVAPLMLVLTGLEGLICVAMVMPIVGVLGFIGALLARAVILVTHGSGRALGWILIIAMPAMLGAEKAWLPELPLHRVESYVDVAAPPEVVWQHVVDFPELPEPTEWLFKMGVAYPTSATLIGEGLGATRYCTFTTGAFVEPITVWDPPHRLAFDVIDNPPPMKEWSIWEVVHPPHLDGHFASERGEFRLERLPDGGTRLIGTTWYRHDIRPAFYWRWWSDYIIHKIHLRVLEQIKLRAENNA